MQNIVSVGPSIQEMPEYHGGWVWDVFQPIELIKGTVWLIPVDPIITYKKLAHLDWRTAEKLPRY